MVLDWKRQISKYVSLIKRGKKPACSVTYDRDTLPELIKYTREKGLDYYLGNEFWCFEDKNLLFKIKIADLPFDIGVQFFSSKKDYHIFCGRLYGHCESAIQKFLDHPSSIAGAFNTEEVH
jgi:hypothetical protein